MCVCVLGGCVSAPVRVCMGGWGGGLRVRMCVCWGYVCVCSCVRTCVCMTVSVM